MIYGIGTDILEVTRMRDAVARSGERFAAKILGVHEFAEYQKRHTASAERGWRYLASRFAAKEAFSKAMGTGMREPLSWHTIEILNTENGKPQLRTHGKLSELIDERRLLAHVTISDEVQYVVAFVVVEQRPGVLGD